MNTRISFTYTKADGESMKRHVLPVSPLNPPDTLTCIDLADLTESKISELEAAYLEYQQYRDLAYAQIFKFQDWLNHTSSCDIIPVYRSFSRSRITNLNTEA